MRVLFIFTCFLAALVSTSAVAEEIVPRTVIALYNGGDIQNSYIHTVAEMPLNHLGLVVEYHDIHEPLPDIVQRADVRGVLTWFMSDTHLNPATYLNWASAALGAGKKFVILGSLGIEETHNYLDSTLANKFLSKLGMTLMDQWVDRPLNVTYLYQTPKMFLAPTTYEWLRPTYQVVHAWGNQTQVHLKAHGADPTSADSDLIITSPQGGYAADGYIFRTNSPEGEEIAQWLINPFEFFRAAFGVDDLPKPDVTTMAGRRVYYSNIDGDGWNNVTQLEEYRDKKILSSQVIMDKVIKPYPDMPVMLALIAADIDPEWAAVQDSRSVARAFLSLPNVEPGSHTYSHPFYWQFFRTGDWKAEIPYLPLYGKKAWRSAEDITYKGKNSSAILPNGYQVPRAYAHEPFDVYKEIDGSIKEINPLLPPDKKVEVLAWSGNCAPWAEAVSLTRDAHVQNINGGDSRFDPQYPAYASVAPIGRQVKDQRQIYNSTSNENTYTNLWSENFNAFEYLKKTLKNTDTPIRVSPLSVYYHIYSGEREASLKALLSNLDYARHQDITPLTVEHYTLVAEGFYNTALVKIAPDRWRVENRGALETIRFDQASFRSVDFAQSKGVVGQRYFQGSLYVYLDAAVGQPIIALKDNGDYFAPSKEADPYLVESRWLISELNRSNGYLDFTAQGFGEGEMAWQMPEDGAYRISIDGEAQTTVRTDGNLLNLKLPNNAQHAVHVTIRKV